MCAIKYILGFCCYKLITLADTGGYYLISPPMEIKTLERLSDPQNKI